MLDPARSGSKNACIGTSMTRRFHKIWRDQKGVHSVATDKAVMFITSIERKPGYKVAKIENKNDHGASRDVATGRTRVSRWRDLQF